MHWILALVGVGGALGVAFAIWFWSLARTVKFKGGAVHYNPNVTAEEARQLARYLESWAFPGGVGLEKKGSTFLVKIIRTEEGSKDSDIPVECATLAVALSDEVFGGATVEIHLCDLRLRSQTVIPSSGQLGTRFRFNAAEIFVTSGVSEDQAVRLGSYLMGKGFFNDKRITGQLNRKAEGFEIRFQVINEEDPGSRKDMVRMASDLARDVFGGLPVEIISCASAQKTLQVQGADPALLKLPISRRILCSYSPRAET
jgi:hypothetical protein